MAKIKRRKNEQQSVIIQVFFITTDIRIASILLAKLKIFISKNSYKKRWLLVDFIV